MQRLLAAQGLVALCAFGAALLLGRPLAAPHLALAVGALPLIFAALLHFVPVLTRSAPAERWTGLLPGLALVAGALAVTAFLGVAAAPLLFVAAAGLALFAALGLALWAAARAAAAVGPPHPCLAWYFAALGCLALGLAAVLLIHEWPGQYAALRRFHLHLNLLGFIGLTAVGTVQVLLPTAAGGADARAAARLSRGLPFALGGALCVATGAGWFAPLAWLGLLLWIAPLGWILRDWRAQFRGEIVAWHGAAPALAVALAGFAALLFHGALHAAGWAEGRAAPLAFVAGFLLPLVTGALTWLLPLWLWPGAGAAAQQAARARLGRHNGALALAWLGAAALLPAAPGPAMALALAALAAFLLKLGAVLLQRPML